MNDEETAIFYAQIFSEEKAAEASGTQTALNESEESIKNKKEFATPYLVGGSIGLPGIWTFIAVTIGGGILGPAGFFLGVPIASAIYKLIRSDIEYREHQLIVNPDNNLRQI